MKTSRQKPARAPSAPVLQSLIRHNVRLDQIAYRPIDELKSYHRKLRGRSAEAQAALVASVRAFGCVLPILVDSKKIIISGEALVQPRRGGRGLRYTARAAPSGRVPPAPGRSPPAGRRYRAKSRQGAHTVGLARSLWRQCHGSARCRAAVAGLCAGLSPVECICARHAKGVLSARVNKSDVHDAEDIAQMARTGWFKRIHMKASATHFHRAAIRVRGQLITPATIRMRPTTSRRSSSSASVRLCCNA